MANVSIVTLLARDIAAGLRDGLSLRDAAGFAWAVNPKATWGELSRALDRARRTRLERDTESPLRFLARMATLELENGATDEKAAACIWTMRPELSERQLSIILRFAKTMRHHG